MGNACSSPPHQEPVRINRGAIDGQYASPTKSVGDSSSAEFDSQLAEYKKAHRKSVKDRLGTPLPKHMRDSETDSATSPSLMPSNTVTPTRMSIANPLDGSIHPVPISEMRQRHHSLTDPNIQWPLPQQQQAPQQTPLQIYQQQLHSQQQKQHQQQQQLQQLKQQEQRGSQQRESLQQRKSQQRESQQRESQQRGSQQKGSQQRESQQRELQQREQQQILKKQYQMHQQQQLRQQQQQMQQQMQMQQRQMNKAQLYYQQQMYRQPQQIVVAERRQTVAAWMPDETRKIRHRQMVKRHTLADGENMQSKTVVYQTRPGVVRKTAEQTQLRSPPSRKAFEAVVEITGSPRRSRPRNKVESMKIENLDEPTNQNPSCQEESLSQSCSSSSENDSADQTSMFRKNQSKSNQSARGSCVDESPSSSPRSSYAMRRSRSKSQQFEQKMRAEKMFDVARTIQCQTFGIEDDEVYDHKMKCAPLGNSKNLNEKHSPRSYENEMIEDLKLDMKMLAQQANQSSNTNAAANECVQSSSGMANQLSVNGARTQSSQRVVAPHNASNQPSRIVVSEYQAQSARNVLPEGSMHSARVQSSVQQMTDLAETSKAATSSRNIQQENKEESFIEGDPEVTNDSVSQSQGVTAYPSELNPFSTTGVGHQADEIENFVPLEETTKSSSYELQNMGMMKAQPTTHVVAYEKAQVSVNQIRCNYAANPDNCNAAADPCARSTTSVNHIPAERCLSCSAGDPCKPKVSAMTPVETSQSTAGTLTSLTGGTGGYLCPGCTYTPPEETIQETFQSMAVAEAAAARGLAAEKAALNTKDSSSHSVIYISPAEKSKSKMSNLSPAKIESISAGTLSQREPQTPSPAKHASSSGSKSSFAKTSSIRIASSQLEKKQEDLSAIPEGQNSESSQEEREDEETEDEETEVVQRVSDAGPDVDSDDEETLYTGVNPFVEAQVTKLHRDAVPAHLKEPPNNCYHESVPKHTLSSFASKRDVGLHTYFELPQLALITGEELNLGRESVLADKNKVTKPSNTVSTTVSGVTLSSAVEDDCDVGTQSMLKKEADPNMTKTTVNMATGEDEIEKVAEPEEELKMAPIRLPIGKLPPLKRPSLQPLASLPIQDITSGSSVKLPLGLRSSISKPTGGDQGDFTQTSSVESNVKLSSNEIKSPNYNKSKHASESNQEMAKEQGDIVEQILRDVPENSPAKNKTGSLQQSATAVADTKVSGKVASLVLANNSVSATMTIEDIPDEEC